MLLVPGLLCSALPSDLMALREKKFAASLETLFHLLTMFIGRIMHLFLTNSSALTLSHCLFSLCLSISVSGNFPVVQCCNQISTQSFFFIPSQQCIDLALLIFSGFSPNLESLQKNFRILCAGGFGNFGDIFRQKMTTFIIYFYFTGS